MIKDLLENELHDIVHCLQNSTIDFIEVTYENDIWTHNKFTLFIYECINNLTLGKQIINRHEVILEKVNNKVLNKPTEFTKQLQRELNMMLPPKNRQIVDALKQLEASIDGLYKTFNDLKNKIYTNRQ